MANDPSAFFRDMLGQWEKLANGIGGDALKSEEFARALGGAGNATLAMQAAIAQGVDKALAATNLPSRSDVTDLSARLARVEASLARIEMALAGAPTAVTPPAPPKVRRTRKPPATPA